MREGKHVILVVDDDSAVRDTLRTVLETHGYVVATAESAEEGLHRFGELMPDLILLDLMIEEVDAGIGFVRELRARGASTPIYFVSAVGDALALTADYTELGVSAVLQKPVSPAILLETIRHKLGEQ